MLHIVLEYFDMSDVRVPYGGNVKWGTQQCVCHPCGKHWQRQHGPLDGRFTEIHRWFTSGSYVEKSKKKVHQPMPHEWTCAEYGNEVQIWREELKQKNYNEDEVFCVLGPELIDLTEG